MPIWLRKFTFKKLSEFYDAQVKANSPKKGSSNIDFANPDKSKVPIKKTVTPPSYITKKSKK